VLEGWQRKVIRGRGDVEGIRKRPRQLQFHRRDFLGAPVPYSIGDQNRWL
jgi:hypothetical protein